MDLFRLYPGCNEAQLIEDAEFIGDRMYLDIAFCEVCQKEVLFLYRREVDLDEYFLTRFDPSFAQWRFIRNTRENFYFKLLNPDQHPARHYVTRKFLTERILTIPNDDFHQYLFNADMDMDSLLELQCNCNVWMLLILLFSF